MVLMPCGSCCGQTSCPRPCSSIRYVSVRFQLGAASGNPIASTLPVAVTGGLASPWSPPGILSSVTSPAIDETLVVDLQQEPGFEVVGTYGKITSFSSSHPFTPCAITYEFVHTLNLGQWPVWNPTGAQTPFWWPRAVTETVSAWVILFPWAGWDASQFIFREKRSWVSGRTYDPRYERTIDYQPATFQECSGPGSWSVTSDSTVGTYPSPGGSYVRVEPAYPNLTNVVPYMDPGPSYFPIFGQPYWEPGYQFVDPFNWRRILPDPVVTVTVS